ncbi:DUF3857 domain-containing protein [Fibrivirga algicola]|uniref:DUF3857 domain-containing protein n=1 Tax=Fibrivirga algicola TaxID=2950420 RepID=A0ABX0QC05_9BACT|nr:DUF3857 domain-containing protein [Fibrivirga algicola]NID08730.1 DUF3857 domain-containing protein [Fibrivirga algicola]
MYILLLRFFIYLFATPFFMRIAAFARLTALCGLLGTFLPFLVCAQAAVQPPVVKFGQVTAADFQLSPIPNDTTAEAVVLYALAETHYEELNSKNTLITEYYKRIRINKKSGYDQATVQIKLWGTGSNAEFSTAIDGVTSRLQHGVVVQQKMDKGAIVTEKLARGETVQKFTLPGVEEGAIIEYRYTTYSPGAITPATWWFQGYIPVLWSEYRMKIPTRYYMKITLGGYLPLAVNDVTTSSSGLQTEYRFAVANAPAFQEEPFITTMADYFSKISFEWSRVRSQRDSTAAAVAREWQDLDRTLLAFDDFGVQYRQPYLLKEEAQLIKATYPVLDTLGKIRAAYDLIRNRIAWNGSAYQYSDQLKKALDERKGDAADINLLLIGLLRLIGLDANPVLLSTRDHGQLDTEHTLLRQFNYVVAHLTLGGKDVMLDATDRFLRPGMLPRRALNGTGRLILPNGKGRFLSLLPTERTVTVKACNFEISADGEAKGLFSQSYDGYRAADARLAHQLLGEEKFMSQVKQLRPDWQIETAELANVSDLTAPVLAKYTLVIPAAASISGDRMYLNPLLTEGITSNPFKQPARQFPVDFATPFDETFTATYIFPEGFTVDELPKPLVLSLPNNGGRFTYQIQQKGNQLDVVSRITIRKPVFGADEYMFLKEFYDKILLKHGEQVVLVQGPVAGKK